jgi:hypothetical protein
MIYREAKPSDVRAPRELHHLLVPIAQGDASDPCS